MLREQILSSAKEAGLTVTKNGKKEIVIKYPPIPILNPYVNIVQEYKGMCVKLYIDGSWVTFQSENYRDKLLHPHVSKYINTHDGNREFCVGSFDDSLYDLYRFGDLTGFLYLIWEAFATPNENDTLTGFTRYRRCYHCKKYALTYKYHTCAHCGDYTCLECSNKKCTACKALVHDNCHYYAECGCEFCNSNTLCHICGQIACDHTGEHRHFAKCISCGSTGCRMYIIDNEVFCYACVSNPKLFHPRLWYTIGSGTSYYMREYNGNIFIDGSRISNADEHLGTIVFDENYKIVESTYGRGLGYKYVLNRE